MRTNRPPVNGDVIRDARLRLGLTQDQVKEECAKRGAPVGDFSRLENGKTRWPSPRKLPVLAEVLGLEVKDLFKAAA